MDEIFLAAATFATALGGVYFVLAPFWSPEAAREYQRTALQERREELFAALEELEQEKEGLSSEDYEAQREELMRALAECLAEIEQHAEARSA